jgi:SAM-dependent methyltransferase
MDIVKREGVDVVASAEDMPFENDSYDIIYSNAVLEHIQDVPRAIAEMHRVLRPGGALILGTHGVWPIHGAPHDYRRWTSHGLMWEFRMFNSVSVRQVGGPLANTVMLVNVYIHQWQERSIALRLLLAPFVTVNNLMGLLFPGDNGREATLAIFYIMTASK